MSRAGLLVSIDGPSGAGKTTVLRLVSQNLSERGLRTCPTAEPSPTPLGNLIRASTDTYRGMSLACLVAGDRHHHLATVIRPYLDAGVIVLTDRYLPSSLVLQRIDGITWSVIWQLNDGADVPDLAVLLRADPVILRQRMTERGAPHSRFERSADGPGRECDLYRDTAAKLAALGWNICEVDTTAVTAAETAAQVTSRIIRQLGSGES
jgi:dTMP kinase